MRLNKLRLIWEAGARLQVWQKRDGFRSLALGDSVEVDDVPVEDVEVMHGAFATALNLPCRPRTYEEMLAGHTREGLRLIDPAPPEGPDEAVARFAYSLSEQDRQAARAALGVPPERPDEELRELRNFLRLGMTEANVRHAMSLVEPLLTAEWERAENEIDLHALTKAERDEAREREVWTLWVVDDNDTPEPRVSVHATERDAEDALRVNYAADRQDLEGDELFSHILRQGLRAGTERHTLA